MLDRKKTLKILSVVEKLDFWDLANHYDEITQQLTAEVYFYGDIKYKQ